MVKQKIIQLTLSDYQRRACASNQFSGKETAIDQLLFGLFGEIGSALSLVKKSHRDLQTADLVGIGEELGDALWYLTTTISEYGSNLNDVGITSLAKLQKHFGVNRDAHEQNLTFVQFDGLVDFCRSKLKHENMLNQLRQIGINCGRLMEGEENNLTTSQHLDQLSTILADIVIVGAHFEQSFASIAENNLIKIESRWPPDGVAHIPLFDEHRTLLEKFPRNFSMKFIQLSNPSGKPYVIQQMNGVNIGDRLTDNRTQADGYRFHDVFHLSYLVHLGWSPVIRALLKLKRKSDSDIDENEDGARAIIIEEGIATWIFNHAHRRDYFENIQTGRLDYNILKQVADMVEGYEVAACPMWQWEKAILDGFEIFRKLNEIGGGSVHVDINQRTLAFEPFTS